MQDFVAWRRYGLWLWLPFCLGITACATDRQSLQDGANGYRLYADKPGLFVSATFAPDGLLWRVVTSKDHVYVDHSNDRGITFSAPVAVNKQSQRIRVSSENRPGVAVDGNNRIYVIYPAEGQQPATLFYSVSSDKGVSFSDPAPLSSKAAEAISLQATLVTDTQGKVDVFWHDDRDRIDYKQLGNSVYYTGFDSQGRIEADRKVFDGFCECCRLAVSFDHHQPLVFGRFIYSAGVRDHGLIRLVDGAWRAQRISDDNWQIEACPEQGPALSIAENGRYHLAWFTQGATRKGLFYARSTDHGQQFSPPLAFGNPDKLPRSPAILSHGDQVILAWSEFDGQKTRLMTMQSHDAGLSWSAVQVAAESASATDRPLLLLGPDQKFYICWNTREDGFRLLGTP